MKCGRDVLFPGVELCNIHVFLCFRNLIFLSLFLFKQVTHTGEKCQSYWILTETLYFDKFWTLSCKISCVLLLFWLLKAEKKDISLIKMFVIIIIVYFPWKNYLLITFIQCRSLTYFVLTCLNWIPDARVASIFPLSFSVTTPRLNGRFFLVLAKDWSRFNSVVVYRDLRTGDDWLLRQREQRLNYCSGGVQPGVHLTRLVRFWPSFSHATIRQNWTNYKL